MDQLPRFGKRELICLLLFTCNYVVFVWRGFLFLWVLGMGYVILLWHSLSLPYNYFGKSLSMLRIPMAMFEKFSSNLNYITSIKVFYITVYNSKSYKLRNIHSIRGMTCTIAIQKGKIYNIKIKVIPFIINFGGNKTVRNRCKSKKGASVSVL